MNSFNTLANIAGQFWLADSIKTSLVGKSAELVEFSEQVIEIDDGPGVNHELVPVIAGGKWTMLGFVRLDDFGVVPGECKNIAMLVLIELVICTHFLIVLKNGFIGLVSLEIG